MQKLFLCIAVLLITSTVFAQTKPLKTKINIDKKDVFVQVDLQVQNSNTIFDNKLNYFFLSLSRIKNTNGYNRSEHSGTFSITPNEKKTLKNIKFNIQKDQEFKFYLYIKNKEKVIAIDSATVGEVNQKLQNTNVKETSIEIKGLVVENMKTKIGRDFYELFYQQYNSSGTKYPFMILLDEKPSRGGTGGGLITVTAEDEKVFEFQSKPDEEFLKSAANYCLKMIEGYNSKRKSFKKIY